MMKRLIATISITLVLMLPGVSSANTELMQLMSNPNNWASWGGDYAGTR